MRLLFPILALVAASGARAETEFFPYPTVILSGAKALETWQAMRDEPGTPVILGSTEEFADLAGSYAPQYAEWYPDSPEDILAKAETLDYPQAIKDLRRTEWEQFLDYLREDGNTDLLEDYKDHDPVDIDPQLIGRIPLTYIPPQRPLGYTDWRTGQPHPEVVIAILPTEAPWEAPAYLRFGGRNANPAPEYHVAALRAWHERYGVEPVVMTLDVLELWAPRRPTGVDEAIALATEHFLYCEDIVYQGLGDIGTLAADRMRAPYWYFWWD